MVGSSCPCRAADDLELFPAWLGVPVPGTVADGLDAAAEAIASRPHDVVVSAAVGAGPRGRGRRFGGRRPAAGDHHRRGRRTAGSLARGHRRRRPDVVVGGAVVHACARRRRCDGDQGRVDHAARRRPRSVPGLLRPDERRKALRRARPQHGGRPADPARPRRSGRRDRRGEPARGRSPRWVSRRPRCSPAGRGCGCRSPATVAPRPTTVASRSATMPRRPAARCSSTPRVRCSAGMRSPTRQADCSPPPAALTALADGGHRLVDVAMASVASTLAPRSG